VREKYRRGKSGWNKIYGDIGGEIRNKSRLVAGIRNIQRR
jgi:hypothetical protein